MVDILIYTRHLTVNSFSYLINYALMFEKYHGMNVGLACEVLKFPRELAILHAQKLNHKLNINIGITISQAEEILDPEYIYVVKNGLETDGIVTNKSKLIVHANSRCYQPHGYSYSYVSEYLSYVATAGKYPYLPHIVDEFDKNITLKESFYKDSSIPEETIIIGFMGGSYAASLPGFRQMIAVLVRMRQDLTFVFVGIEKFINHERVYFRKPILLREEKEYFFSIIDCFLHLRLCGESFGITVSEAISANTPVLCYYPANSIKKCKFEKAHLWHHYNDLLFYTSLADLFLKLGCLKKESLNSYISQTNNPSFTMASVATQAKSVFRL
jgi:hypothetical protein